MLCVDVCIQCTHMTIHKRASERAQEIEKLWGQRDDQSARAMQSMHDRLREEKRVGKQVSLHTTKRERDKDSHRKCEVDKRKRTRERERDSV